MSYNYKSLAMAAVQLKPRGPRFLKRPAPPCHRFQGANSSCFFEPSARHPGESWQLPSRYKVTLIDLNVH